MEEIQKKETKHQEPQCIIWNYAAIRQAGVATKKQKAASTADFTPCNQGKSSFFTARLQAHFRAKHGATTDPPHKLAKESSIGAFFA